MGHARRILGVAEKMTLKISVRLSNEALATAFARRLEVTARALSSLLILVARLPGWFQI
jgi:hypothetical protein